MVSSYLVALPVIQFVYVQCLLLFSKMSILNFNSLFIQLQFVNLLCDGCYYVREWTVGLRVFWVEIMREDEKIGSTGVSVQRMWYWNWWLPWWSGFGWWEGLFITLKWRWSALTHFTWGSKKKKDCPINAEVI